MSSLPSHRANALARAVLAATLLLAALCAPVRSSYAMDPGGASALIVAATVNGSAPVDPVAVLRGKDGKYLISETGLRLLHLRIPTQGAVLDAAQNFYPLDVLDGAKGEFDASTQTLHLSVAGSAFVSGSYDEHYVAPQQLDSSATGGFFNYDVFYQGSQPQSLSALVEGGAFFYDGTLTTRYIFQDIAGHHDGYRLDTQYVRDDPEHTATLVLGDSVSDASAWSRSVYFGGIQWHTNFGTRPDVQALPLPSISGTAAVPSTVDLYVDNVLRGHQSVDAGPFTLANVPAFSGQGNLMVVVHDPLGREQLFVQSYLSSALLLKSGISDFGYEAGALRENFGQRSANYGPEFGSGEYRVGIDANDTLELHAEQSQGLVAGGAGLSRAIGTFGVLTVGGAASHDGGNSGVLGYGQFDRQTSTYGLSVRTQWSNQSFRELGLSQGESTPKDQTQAQLNFSLGYGTSFLAGYTRQSNRDNPSIQTLNYGLTWSGGRYGSIFAGLLKSFAPSRSMSVNLVWTVPLGGQRFLQMAANRDGNARQSSLEYDDAPPAELGWGVRLRRSFADLAGDDAGVTYRSQIGELSVAASNTSGRNIAQGEARGGFAIIGGHIIPTKWLDQSFALVTVPASQPIDIYSNGVKVGHTNADGYGFVPNLVAYEPNHVMLDASNLPLQMTVELATHDVVPRSRSGVVVAFEATQNMGARATLTYADGRPIETGADVVIESSGTGKNTPATPAATVALRGDVYFTDLNLPANLVVHTKEGMCRIAVGKSANDDAIPNLGVLKCAP